MRGENTESEESDDSSSETSEENKQKLSAAQASLGEAQSALSAANKVVDSLKSSKQAAAQKVAVLEKEITGVEGDLAEISKEMGETEDKIQETKDELEETQAEKDKQYEDMKKRIRFMYINSSKYYLTLLLSSDSISSFLNQAEYIGSINTYDRNMLDEFAETITKIEKEQDELEEELAKLEEEKKDAEDNRSALVKLEEARQAELSDIQEDLTDAQAVADMYEAEVRAQNEIIAQIQAAENAKNASGQDNSSQIDSRYGFLWPCPSSTRVTSDFGSRTSPTKGASTYHKGIDIGASYGSAIVAAQNGTVAAATYSSSCGNYVMIDHGAGVYTVYMHASSLAVSAGQQVTRGQTIAAVGSTGISTGNHLHFGVSVGGSYVSPWNYVSR